MLNWAVNCLYLDDTYPTTARKETRHPFTLVVLVRKHIQGPTGNSTVGELHMHATLEGPPGLLACSFQTGAMGSGLPCTQQHRPVPT